MSKYRDLPPIPAYEMLGYNIEKNLDEFFEQLDLEINAKQSTIMSNKPNEKSIVYGAPGYDFYLLETYLIDKRNEGVSTHKYIDKSVWIRKEKVNELITALCKNFNLVGSYRTRMCFRGEKSFVIAETASNDIDNIEIHSTDKEEADKIVALFESFKCTEKKVGIRWIYDREGRSIDRIETFEENVTADLYPYIKDFDTFAERFMSSKSNILLLIGEPGTGKTTFIKNLLAETDKLSYLTYDEKVLDSDYIFASYMEDDEAASFVIEDADMFLRPRKDGNGLVSRFLNVGDGLIKLKDKKIIFSTNLPNIQDIDPALIRPGRCFDIINFRRLTRDEAKVVTDVRNIVLPGDEFKKDYTLAEIFNNPVEKPKEVNSKFGFC